MRENRISYCIHGHDLSVAAFFIVEYPESVAFLQPEEIHCPCVDIRQGEHKQRRHIGVDHVVPQRGPYRDVGIFMFDSHGLGYFKSLKGRRAAENHLRETILVIYEIFQFPFLP